MNITLGTAISGSGTEELAVSLPRIENQHGAGRHVMVETVQILTLSAVPPGLEAGFSIGASKDRNRVRGAVERGP